VPGADPRQLDDRGADLLQQHLDTGDVPVLLAAIGLFRAAVAASPESDLSRVQYLSHLSVAARRLYEATGQVEMLREAIVTGRASVQATPQDHSWYARRLSNYANALQRSYERSRDLPALAQAARAQRLAADRSSGRTRAVMLMNLCMALRQMGAETGQADYIRQAIAAGREGIDVLAPGDPEEAGLLSNVGLALRALFQLDGDIAVLQEAVSISRHSVDVLSADHPYWPGRQHNLGLALRHMYEQTADIAALEQAVLAHRAALDRVGGEHPATAMCATGLSGALRRLFQLRGDSEDLHEAIRAARQAVDASPADHRKLAVRLVNLGGVLLARYERGSSSKDLTDAIAVARRSIAAAPPGHPDHADSLALLGTALHREAEATGRPDLVAEAVERARRAVAVTPPGYADRGMHLSNLGAALLAQYDRVGDAALLQEAASTYGQAMAATPHEHSRRSHRLLDMGHALARAFGSVGEPAIGEQAHNAFHEAACSTATPVALRIHAYRADARLGTLTGDWREATERYAAAVALLPQTAARHRARADREHGIADIAGLATEAASVALAARCPEQALVLLEEGRGVILNEDIAVRGGLTELRQLNPGYAEQLVRLRALLNAGETDAIDVPGAAARRQDLATRWDMLLSQIRALPEMAGFGAPLTFAELQAQATAGPLIFVNVADYRSDALILTAGDLKVVPLPHLSPATAKARAESFLAAVDTSPARQDVVLDTLGWLWDTVAEPVLDALGFTAQLAGSHDWPRVWWCPTGALTQLPLHAAGHHAEPGQATVLDYVISSYLPTVRALAHARSHRPYDEDVGADGGADSHHRVLAVAMPHTPDACDLPGAMAEVAMLKRLVSSQATVLAGRQATHESVLAQLPTARWAHFACHGFSESSDPSVSRLLLHDHKQRPLTVVDIARLLLDQAELAFLSACSTAQPGTRLADEAIHLASAFQLIGYRHVISTLWSINDRPAVRIAEDIYTGLTAPGTVNVAAVVHAAIRRSRDRWAEAPSVWAAHVHVGP
jgi:tetratricopeptide (TPR) repeat protein